MPPVPIRECQAPAAAEAPAALSVTTPGLIPGVGVLHRPGARDIRRRCNPFPDGWCPRNHGTLRTPLACDHPLSPGPYPIPQDAPAQLLHWLDRDAVVSWGVA